MRTELIFVRHGETEYNRKKLYFGHLDPGLNDLGRKQVTGSKKLLKDVEIEAIYSSDLKRCMETSQIINEGMNKEIIRTANLRELNFGIFEGKTYGELLKDFPKHSTDFFNNWESFKIPEGESLLELQNRCIKEIEKIRLENIGKTVLVSTHFGCVQAILSYYLCEGLAGYWKFAVDNGSLTKLSFVDDFVYINYLNKV
jgi:alpha-ribazole phosphatase/probable phosphoglycerate mutase